MRTHSVEDKPRQRTKRKGLASILEAFHRSRRREGIQVLRRYRHLVAGQAQIRPVKHVPESRQAETSSRNAHGNNAPVRADRKESQDTGTQLPDVMPLSVAALVIIAIR